MRSQRRSTSSRPSRPTTHETARRVSTLPRGYRRNAQEREGASGGRPEALNSLRGLLPEDGYDAGVKKPVADPKSWRVPFGKDWVTSKLQELENLVQTGGWVEAEIGEMRVSIPTG
jgi:hypothetical protein